MSVLIKVPHKPLGSQGLICSQQGIGCMGMSMITASTDIESQEIENQKTITKALELGINMFDTAWRYVMPGPDGQLMTNESVLGRAIKIHGRDKFIICTKFGSCPPPVNVSGSEETIRSQLADSLARLGTDYIDLYYQHRMDPNTPIEVTMRVLKSLVEQGTIHYIGLSECTPSELRRAHAVHPITAIQMEWSLQTRSIEAEIVPTARELGVGIVAYSPMGRGLLTGAITSKDSLDPSDPRFNFPRFQAANLDQNVASSAFRELAVKHGATPAQLALAWLHAQGEDVFPIPGTKSSTRIVENAGAVELKLSAEDVKQVEAAVPQGQGDRYFGVHAGTTFDSRL